MEVAQEGACTESRRAAAVENRRAFGSHVFPPARERPPLAALFQTRLTCSLFRSKKIERENGRSAK